MKRINEKLLVVLFCALFFASRAHAENGSFTNCLAQGELSEKNGDVSSASRFYWQAEQLGCSNAADLCVLTRNYCDLMHSTDSAAGKKHLLESAMACASQAMKIDPKSSTAHASMAVCYAKASSFVGIREKVAYSRLIKEEVEEAIALNPKEDVAYYLLGRWNCGVANIGLFPRTYVRVVYGGLPYASNEEAIRDFKQAITLAPGHILYHTGLAMAYETTGQKNLALAELKVSAGLKPLDRDDEDAQREAVKELNSMPP
ncbi:MAG TPA: hypothetical protein VGJ73_07220 [Verrucomicrobiae bacterium]|jgi:tetratricopeptide (TPR) repeat protein